MKKRKIKLPYYEVTAPSAMLPKGRNYWSNRIQTKSLLRAFLLWLFYKETILYFCSRDLSKLCKVILSKKQRKAK